MCMNVYACARAHTHTHTHTHSTKQMTANYTHQHLPTLATIFFVTSSAFKSQLRHWDQDNFFSSIQDIYDDHFHIALLHSMES